MYYYYWWTGIGEIIPCSNLAGHFPSLWVWEDMSILQLLDGSMLRSPGVFYVTWSDGLGQGLSWPFLSQAWRVMRYLPLCCLGEVSTLLRLLDEHQQLVAAWQSWKKGSVFRARNSYHFQWCCGHQGTCPSSSCDGWPVHPSHGILPGDTGMLSL